MDLDIRNARESITCWLCGKRGHIALRCPDRRTQLRSMLIEAGSSIRAAMFEEIQHMTETEGVAEEGIALAEEQAVEDLEEEDFGTGQT